MAKAMSSCRDWNCSRKWCISAQKYWEYAGMLVTWLETIQGADIILGWHLLADYLNNKTPKLRKIKQVFRDSIQALNANEACSPFHLCYFLTCMYSVSTSWCFFQKNRDTHVKAPQGGDCHLASEAWPDILLFCWLPTSPRSSPQTYSLVSCIQLQVT